MTSSVKARQSAKIQEIADALRCVGYLTLDEQAGALGLGRSTTWVLIKGFHKCSGLSAAIINRMLASPDLPPSVRQKIDEYVAERLAGLYGHSPSQRRKFAARLTVNLRPAALDLDREIHKRQPA